MQALAKLPHYPSCWLKRFGEVTSQRFTSGIHGIRQLIQIQTSQVCNELAYTVYSQPDESAPGAADEKSSERSSPRKLKSDEKAGTLTVKLDKHFVQASIENSVVYKDTPKLNKQESGSAKSSSSSGSSSSSAGSSDADGDSKMADSASASAATPPRTVVSVYSGDCLECAQQLLAQGLNPCVLSECPARCLLFLTVALFPALLLAQTWHVRRIPAVAGSLVRARKKKTCSAARSTRSR